MFICRYVCIAVSVFVCVCSLDRLGARQFFIQNSVSAPSTRNGMQMGGFVLSYGKIVLSGRISFKERKSL